MATHRVHHHHDAPREQSSKKREGVSSSEGGFLSSVDVVSHCGGNNIVARVPAPGLGMLGVEAESCGSGNPSGALTSGFLSSFAFSCSSDEDALEAPLEEEMSDESEQEDCKCSTGRLARLHALGSRSLDELPSLDVERLHAMRARSEEMLPSYQVWDDDVADDGVPSVHASRSYRPGWAVSSISAQMMQDSFELVFEAL
mmetsp:Transcript_33906/g.107583  ORF Transcript_33906/g.107583 Transcript_33906/m.107583 type:complete len:200 (+) Transcript_33906:47-646(+)